MDSQNNHPGTNYPFFYVYLRQTSPAFDTAFDKVNETGLSQKRWSKNAYVDLSKDN